MQELGGSTTRQTTKLANGNVPYHKHHAQFMNGGWPGGGKRSFCLISMTLNPLLAVSSNFFGAENQSSGSEKKCTQIGLHIHYYHYYRYYY